jgi:hypothetical protein
MCGSQNMEHTTPASFMSEENWKHLCAMVPTGWCIEINALGEHSLHPQFDNFVEYLARKRGGEVFLKWNTNGMWGTKDLPWSENKIKELLRLFSVLNASGNYSQIIFSFDGASAETVEYIRRGVDFNRVMQNIRLCIKESGPNVEVGVAYVAMKRNLYEAQPLLESLPGLNYFYLNILNVCTDDMIPEALIDLKQEYYEMTNPLYHAGTKMGTKVTFLHPILSPKTSINGCNFPMYMWVDTQGSVYVCCRRWDAKIGHVSMGWDEIISLGRRVLGETITGRSCDICFSEGESWGWQRHFQTEAFYEKYKRLKADGSLK